MPVTYIKRPSMMKRKYDRTRSRSAPKKRVARKTTMQELTLRTPFPRQKKCDMLYEHPLTHVGGATYFKCEIANNDMFDFDRTGGNVFGNKQPLYFDDLFGANGPYKEFYVGSWETTYTVINETAECGLNVYALPSTGVGAELDSITEAANFPGVVTEYLTSKGGSKDIVTITIRGNVKDHTASSVRDDNFLGSYASSPTAILYGGILVSSADGASNLTAAIAIKHVFHAECQWIDALIST